jgi:hypothetical protein
MLDYVDHLNVYKKKRTKKKKEKKKSPKKKACVSEFYTHSVCAFFFKQVVPFTTLLENIALYGY